MVTAHFVNHTHWDREWYFTTQDAQVLSDQLFGEVLTELEQHPEANFTFDGQLSIVEEYLTIHPEDQQRIKQLVLRKQLFIGPWYTQTDALIPDSESIIRNLVIGIIGSRQLFGQAMMIGYLPDTFGFNAQLPMLLNQVGIQDFICWRGTNFARQVDSVYFQWQGLGHNQVYAANFPLGYYTGQIDLNSKQHLQEFVAQRLDPGIDLEAKHGQNDPVLIPSGIDQMNIIHNISQVIQQLNQYSKHQIVLSSYPQFMQQLRNQDLPKYQGELRYPTYSRVHRTIGSVRSQLKRQNFKLEQQILRRVEPLMVIAQACGIKVSNGLVLKLWKKLLKCQPHDTLGGSITDNVAVDVQQRFKEGFEIAAGIENYIKKRLAQRLHLNSNQLLLFNTSPRVFDGYQEVEFLATSKKVQFAEQYQAVLVRATYVPKRKHIMQQTAKGFEFKDEPGYYRLTVRLKMHYEGLGYQVVSYQTAATELVTLENSSSLCINNQKWQVQYTGTAFVAKTLGHVYPHVLEILDSGNDGDTYDYSPLPQEQEVSLPLTGQCQVQTAPHLQTMTVQGTWHLPKSLAERQQAHPQLIDVDFKIILSLAADSSILDGQLIIDNQALDHRLRLKINTGIKSSKAWAQIQGGFRSTTNLPIADNWQDEFVEKPVNLYNFDKVVGMYESKQGLFLLSGGMKEYELLDQGFAVTLLATTGQLGKPNLLWRPGRASGDTTSVGHQMTPTPLAEEIGSNHFVFGLVAVEDLDENQLALTAENWLAPNVNYQLQKLNLFVNRLDNKIWDVEFDPSLPQLPHQATLLQIDPKITITALYCAYTIKNAIVIRLSNQANKTVDLTQFLAAGFQRTNALEEVQSSSENAAQLAPYEMATFIKIKG